MSISLPTALALLALVLVVFCLLAISALYTRLRHLEMTSYDPGSESPMPAQLRPRHEENGAMVMVLDGVCPSCTELWEGAMKATEAGELEGMRLVAVFSNAEAATGFDGGDLIEVRSDPDTWSAAYEGYTPSLSLIDGEGTVRSRRFIYPDTDVRELLTQLATSVPRQAISQNDGR